jgi:flagella basal body P-ring formation protein FlgA
MKPKSEISAADARDIKFMFDLVVERGCMTGAQMLHAGVKQESLIRNGPAVAAMVRNAGIQIAA